MALCHTKGGWKAIDFEPKHEDKSFHCVSQFEQLDEYEIDNGDIKLNEKRRKVNRSYRQANETNSKKLNSVKKRCEDAIVPKTKSVSRKIGKRKLTQKVEDEGINVAYNYVDVQSWVDMSVPEPILQSLIDLGFKKPTPIQLASIPPAISGGKDILGAAETGSGKTLAFGIPIVAGLLRNSSSNASPSALILIPTRELAVQVKSHIDAIVTHTNLKIVSIVGGLSVQKQERLLNSKPDVIIATPGRLWSLMEENLANVQNLKDVKYLAVDEIDRMVEKGHFEELNNIVEYLNTNKRQDVVRQTFVFSATLTFVHPLPKRLLAKRAKPVQSDEKIENLISLFNLRPRRELIDLTQKSSAMSSSLTQSCLYCTNLLRKDASLYYFLLKYPGRTLIFVNSVDCARRLRSVLTTLRLDVRCLHAGMEQKKRLESLEHFQRNACGVLVATDVAARGLDVENIEHVVHYHVPRTAELYVHRSGRTARRMKQGFSLALVDKRDAPTFRKICKALQSAQSDPPVFPIVAQEMEECKQIVAVATELESIAHRLRANKDKKSWFKSAAKEADLVLDYVEDKRQAQAESGGKERMAELKLALDELLENERPRKCSRRTMYPLFVDHDSDDDPLAGVSAIDTQTVCGSGRRPKFAYGIKKRKEKLGKKRVSKKGHKKRRRK